MNKIAAGSLGAVTAHRIKWILSGRSAVEHSSSKRCKLGRLLTLGPRGSESPLSAFQITETKEGGMMVITTTLILQMHDIVKNVVRRTRKP